MTYDLGDGWSENLEMQLSGAIDGLGIKVDRPVQVDVGDDLRFGRRIRGGIVGA